MCDFREPPNQVLFKETAKLRDLPLLGHYGAVVDIPTEKLEFGLYHIGMSGCGYKFYDGKVWSSIDTTIPVQVWGTTKYLEINGETEKYKFYRPDEWKPNRWKIHDDYVDIEKL